MPAVGLAGLDPVLGLFYGWTLFSLGHAGTEVPVNGSTQLPVSMHPGDLGEPLCETFSAQVPAGQPMISLNPLVVCWVRRLRLEDKAFDPFHCVRVPAWRSADARETGLDAPYAQSRCSRSHVLKDMAWDWGAD